MACATVFCHRTQYTKAYCAHVTNLRCANKPYFVQQEYLYSTYSIFI